MKTHPLRNPLPTRGFALIVTISLMILLTVIAVGLLTLSSISLRSAARGSDLATARANARVAFLLALGDLQKLAGPDQRITARADIRDGNSANARLTGVWKSWDIQATSPPSASDYQKAERDKKFLGWLASAKIAKAADEVNFAQTAPASPATLWGKGTLGETAPAGDIVRAAKIPTASSRGAIAWAVMDEGVKVRINTPTVDSTDSEGMKTTRLGSGQRPDTSMIDELSPLDSKFFEDSTKEFALIGKGVTRMNMQLAAEKLAPGTGEKLREFTHDLTTTSTGLFTDVASGGLKEDFNLLVNSPTLPSEYRSSGVYATRLGMAFADVPSDPEWASLQQIATLYKTGSRLTTSGGVPLIRAQGPPGWRAASGSNPTSGDQGRVNRNPPPGVILMPSVVKVQIVFSLLTRDIYNYPKVSDTTPKAPGTEAQERAAESHGPWGSNFAGSKYDYLLHLMYAPVVTLHNPYNVALEFRNLKILFGNVPFGLQVFRNRVPQTTAPAPLDQMYYQDAELGRVNKRFGMTLKTNGGRESDPRPGSTTFRMLPGEVILFSPYIDPNASWANNAAVADWNSANEKKTLAIDGIPGWRGDGIGFDLDWFAPSGIRTDGNEHDNGKSMSRGGCIGAAATDTWTLKFAPLSVPGLSNNKFTVEMFASPTGGSQVSSQVIEMDYEKPTGLQDSLVGRGGTITYPKTGTINTMEMHSHRSTPLKDIATVKPFAIVSAQAKTTNGGLDPTGEDGKLATKPWAFAHAVIGAVSEKLVSEHPANQSHEFSIERLDHGTANLLQFDPNSGRGNFVSGLTGDLGVKFGAMYDIPLAPLQSFASLNAANPGGSSGYLPRFARPIGNSWAHPLIEPGKIVQSGGSYPYLDHSFLLNLALYDHFYFSGIADRTGSFGNGQDAAAVAADFLAGKPLTDPRLGLYRPDGLPAAEFTKLVNADDAYKSIAAWQTMEGAFNINSTSVPAWTAMLASIHSPGAIFNKIDKSAKSSAFDDLPDVGKDSSRISRFRLPASESEENGADPEDGYWLGAREYSRSELETLAKNIVNQVRKRGPFLSMSDFVNRQLGSGDEAQRGALQQAIDDSNLNAAIATTAGAGYDIAESQVAGYGYNNPAAGAGASYQGAPGYLSQSDLLAVLGDAATPRSDTFTIRGYGEARDKAGNVTATAICEAVVQRLPDYLDAADKAETAPTDLTSDENKLFGRRFHIVSFRWLTPKEV